jgi:hypothetical protein
MLAFFVKDHCLLTRNIYLEDGEIMLLRNVDTELADYPSSTVLLKNFSLTAPYTPTP